MKLRALRQEDAEYMLEWMHDPFVVENLQTNFAEKSISDCREFIQKCNDLENIHLAIADQYDEYMGTVSLKHIYNKKAEFAIVLTKKAIGKSYANWAMKEILRLGFDKYQLESIYWCVSNDNKRAINFYDKHRYSRISSIEIGNIPCYTNEQISSYIWYQVKKNEMLNIME